MVSEFDKVIVGVGFLWIEIGCVFNVGCICVDICDFNCIVEFILKGGIMGWLIYMEYIIVDVVVGWVMNELGVYIEVVSCWCYIWSFVMLLDLGVWICWIGINGDL